MDGPPVQRASRAQPGGPAGLTAGRQAAVYRDCQVLLAGDSAHVHSPAGGQGLTAGFQAAVNLGWKVAQVVKRTSPDTLLDTYHAERHPAGHRMRRR